MNRKKQFTDTLHHFLSRAALALAVVIVLVATLLTVLRASTPLLSQHRADIQRWLSDLLKRPIAIGQVSAGWHGFEPVIKINNTELYTPNHQKLMGVKSFVVGFDLWDSLLTRHLQIGLIAIRGAAIDVKQFADGTVKIYENPQYPIATMLPHQRGQGHLLTQLLSVNKISITQVNVTWYRADGTVIPVHQLKLEMINNDDFHHLWGTASLKQTIPTQLAFVSKFRGDVLHRRTLSGDLYLHARDVDITQWLPSLQWRSIALEHGEFSGQAWLTWNQGQLEQLQSKFTVSYLTMKGIHTHHRLLIPSFRANFLWERKLNGWAVSGNQIELSASGQPKPAAKLYLTAERGDGKPTNYQFFMNRFPLALSSQLLTLYGREQGTMPRQIEPWHLAGLIKDFYIQYRDKEHFAVHGKLEAITLHRMGKAPSVKNINGDLYLYPKRGELILASDELRLLDPQWLDHPVVLEKLKSHVFWQRNPNGWNVFSKDLFLQNKDLTLHGKMKIFIGDKTPSDPYVSLILNANPFQANIIKHYLPKAVFQHKKLTHFLETGFVAGTGSSTLMLQGYINRFPFADHQGVFRFDTVFSHVQLHYKDGWPDLKGANGELVIQDASLRVKLYRGEMFGTPIQEASASIPQLVGNQVPELNIKAKANGTLQRGLAFLRETPLREHVGKHLEGVEAEGPMGLQLQLRLPLTDHSHQDKVTGVITSTHGTLTVPAWGVRLSQVQGQLSFTNHVLYGRDLTADFLEHPVTLNVTTLTPERAEPITQINLTGLVAMSTLQKRFNFPIIKKINGVTKYQAQLQLRNGKKHANSLLIQSALKRIDVPFPYPFEKNTATPIKTSALFHFKEHDPKVTVELKMGQRMQAALILQKQKTHGLRFISGNLHLGRGNALLQKQKGLYINGKLNRFDWAVWKSYLEKNNGEKSSWQRWFRKLNVRVRRLHLLQHRFLNTQVQMQLVKKRVYLGFNGPAIAGNLRLPDRRNDVLWGRLTRLYLAKSKVKRDSNHDVDPRDLPPMNLQIKDFRYGSLVIGETHLLTTRMKRGLAINNLMANSHVFKLTATGTWQIRKGKNQSRLKGELAAATLGDVLAPFGYPRTVDARNLRSEFNVRWQGVPYDVVLKRMQGTIALETGAGRIIDIGQKANEEVDTGQILTLLSLQSLQKRVLMKFDDLRDKGFAFNNLQGRFVFQNGVASTKNTRIQGLVAGLKLRGDIGIANKNFNLYLDVTPHLTASLPVIATIAGGPLVGAATWVVNKLISPAVNQITTQHYRITGTWKKPLITRLRPQGASRQRRGKWRI